jgi:hypothetical protein
MASAGHTDFFARIAGFPRRLSMSRFLLATTACALIAASSFARDDKDAKYFKLLHVDSGKVLGVADDSEEAGARTVIVKEDGKNPAQQWKLEKDGDFYKLVNRKTGKVLDVNENSTDEDAAIIQWDDKGDDNDNQRWSWLGDGAERRLKSKSSRLVLDTDGEGRIIQKKVDEKAKRQLWKVIEVK